LPWRSMVQTTSYMCWTMSTTRSRCFRSIRTAARWRLSPEAPSRCFRAQATKILGQTRSPYSTEGDERQFAKCVATRGLKRCDTSEPRCQLLEALPWDSAPRCLLRDRDACYGKEFHEARGWLGIRDVLTAPRSPWQNPYVERLIGTIRRECLDHVIVLNETGLRRVLKLHFEYYERTRTHLSLDKDAAIPRRVHPPELGKVVKLPEVGRLASPI
jgi:transposase InsO family protein